VERSRFLSSEIEDTISIALAKETRPKLWIFPRVFGSGDVVPEK